MSSRVLILPERQPDDYLAQFALPESNAFKMQEAGAIKEVVKLGLDVTGEAPWVAARELAEGPLVALPIRANVPIRKWVLITPRDRPATLTEELFRGLCRTVASTFAT